MSVTVSDYRADARRALPRFLFEYLDGGAQTERTLRRNEADLADVSLRQRVLVDVSEVTTRANLLGRSVAMPLVLAPVGLAGLYARRGERQAARAAHRHDIPFCLSTVGACAIDEVAEASGSPIWFQLYMMRDRALASELLAAAQEAGVTTLVMTVDMPAPGLRYRDHHSGFTGSSPQLGALRRMLQALARPGWAWDVGVRGRPHTLGNIAPALGERAGVDDFIAWMAANFDPTVTWRDLADVRQAWPGKLVIKGILDAQDARRVCDLGADAIVVSNHGGRQLDGAPATAAVLPAIADAVDRRLEVLVDGGVRSGTDIVKMLALGADGVLMGRPWVYALASGGEAAVSRLLAQLHAEMRITMALAGLTDVGAIDRGALAPCGSGASTRR
jgi:L-lactate dehydrogenase (cytochrome)